MKPMKPMVERKVHMAALALKVELDILKELAAEEPKPEPALNESETATECISEALKEVSG